MKKYLFGFFGFLVGFLYFSPVLNAATENGITITYTRDREQVNGVFITGTVIKSAEYFTDYSFGTSSIVYNEDGATSSASGRVKTKSFIDARNVSVSVVPGTDGTTSIYFVGWVGSTTSPIIFYTEDYGTTTEESIPIPEYYQYVAIGGIDTVGDGNSTIKADFVNKE